jgi:hypothetical protein
MVAAMSSRWLVITHALALMSFFAVLAPFLGLTILGVYQTQSYGGLIVLCVFSPLWLPFLGGTYDKLPVFTPAIPR